MKQISTYFCDDFLTYESIKIDTSLCLGFYLKNLEDLEEFHQFMHKLSLKHKDDMFFWFENVRPNWMDKDEELSDKKE